MKLMNQQDRAKFIFDHKLTPMRLNELNAAVQVNSHEGVTNMHKTGIDAIIHHAEALQMDLEDTQQQLAEAEVKAKTAERSAEMYRTMFNEAQEGFAAHHFVGQFASAALTGMLAGCEGLPATDLAAKQAFGYGKAMAKEFRETAPQPKVDDQPKAD